MKTAAAFVMILAISTGLASRAQVSTATPPQPARADVAQLAWLEGTWIGSQNATTYEERWTPPAGGAMLGVSRTIAKGQMAAFEFLRIVSRDGTLVYIAQPGGRPATEFTLTAVTSDSATFENPAHDFPKVIRYSLRPDGTLDARISDGGSRGRSFEFRRQR